MRSGIDNESRGRVILCGVGVMVVLVAESDECRHA